MDFFQITMILLEFLKTIILSLLDLLHLLFKVNSRFDVDSKNIILIFVYLEMNDSNEALSIAEKTHLKMLPRFTGEIGSEKEFNKIGIYFIV